MRQVLRFGVLAVTLLTLGGAISGCYRLRPSNGGGSGSVHLPNGRDIDGADIALPPGYHIDAMAQGLTFPTGATFDDQGRLYVVEAGYCYGEVFTTPRLLRVEANGQVTPIVSGTNGPWTGVAFHQGSFFVAEGGVMEGGRILRISPDGKITILVDGLPSFGDHHTDGPAVSPDGWIYFGQGTASNAGIVGKDNAKFGWLKRHPEFHDVPGSDIELAGVNVSKKDVLHPGKGRVETGAFVPFGTSTKPGQVIKGAVKCSGGILRVRPDGSDLQLVAWGFRNPFGLAFAPDGQLYVTDNGYDDRGSRPVWGSPDVLWRVQPKLWYGWPDFSAGEPLNTKYFQPPGKSRPEFLLAKHSNPPPRPVTTFGVHSSSDGLDFSRSGAFGHVGDAFVALFGDQSPTVGKLLHPVGFKVVRVDVQRGLVEDFAVNRGRHNGPASQLGTGGFERPIAARFSPDGSSLVIVDFGILKETRQGARPQPGTGVIWRINRNAPAEPSSPK